MFAIWSRFDLVQDYLACCLYDNLRGVLVGDEALILVVSDYFTCQVLEANDVTCVLCNSSKKQRKTWKLLMRDTKNH